MRKIKNWFLITFLLFSATALFAQGKITGFVKEGNTPLPGANITIEGTTVSTSSSFDGSFTLTTSQSSGNILISYLGYKSKTVPFTVSNGVANVGTILIESEDRVLEQVVVIGYGTAKKRDLTGSIVKVNGSEISDKPNTNPLASLQGKVAGLTVVNTGQPGSEPDIRIRGTVSLFNTKPLYVIDGIFNDNMSFVNPNDIESIEVLKDASSLAVFGSRGANGVVIVTTKRAKSGRTIVNYNASLSIKNMSGKPEMTNAEEFKQLYNQQLVNQGSAPYGFYSLYTADTDWIDEISNKNAAMSIQNLSISNSTEKNKFYLGLGYTTEEGLIKNELYKKFTFNINDELQIGNTIKVGGGISVIDARLPRLGSFGSALNATPIVAPFNNQYGIYNQLPTGMGDAQLGNPLLEVEGKSGTQLNRDTRFVGNIFGEIKIIDNLKLRGAYLADLDFNHGRSYLPVFDVYVAESNTTTKYGGNALTAVSQFKNESQKLQQEITLNYDKSFGEHSFNALIGYSRNEEYFSGMNGSVRQKAYADSNSDGIDDNMIPNDPRWWYIDVYPFGDITTKKVNTDQWDRSLVSYLGRVMYNYKGKYLLNGSFRRDGSSEVHKFQNFWAFGAAWEVAKEGFMQNQKFFNSLKLKTSFGQLGNQFTSVHYPTYPTYTAGASAVFGEQLVPSFILEYRNNPDLKWEVVTSKEFGVEFLALDNKLSFEANYYDKTTKDLLTYVSLGSEKFYTNAGEISNKGFEFIASWRKKVNQDFDYSISGNLTTIKNKVNSVFEPGYQIVDGVSRVYEGQPIGYFYGYEVEGIYQSYADILNSPPSTLGSYDVGDFKFKDVNGDGVINTSDRTIIGNPTPDFTYGFSMSMNYKNWNFGIDFQGVYGNEIYRYWGNGSTFAQFNYRKDRLNAWNGPGSTNSEPRVNDSSAYNVVNPSSYMVEDGSYLRLRNVQIGYNFKNELLKKVKIENLKLYLNAQNLATWKNNSGFTPESGGSPTSFGIDNGGYPIPVITTLGLNVTF